MILDVGYNRHRVTYVTSYDVVASFLICAFTFLFTACAISIPRAFQMLIHSDGYICNTIYYIIYHHANHITSLAAGVLAMATLISLFT